MVIWAKHVAIKEIVKPAVLTLRRRKTSLAFMDVMLSFTLKLPGKINSIQWKTGRSAVWTRWQTRRLWSLPRINDWTHPGSKAKDKYEIRCTVAIKAPYKANRVSDKKSERGTDKEKVMGSVCSRI
jgi:hypothetical protein